MFYPQRRRRGSNCDTTKYQRPMKTTFLSSVSRLFFALCVVAVCFALNTPSASAEGITIGNNGDGFGFSYAVNAANRTSFSYFDANNVLNYTQFNGTSWVTELVDTSLANSSDTALVLKSDTPHIFYLNDTNKLVHAYKSVSNSWVKEVISASDSIAGSLSAANCESDLCVSFYNSVNRDQKFARQVGGVWQISTVDASTDDVGVMNSIAVSSSGTLVIAYYDATNKRLKVASKTTTGTWQVESVGYLDSKFGLYPSVAIDASQTIHVSSSKYKSASTLHDAGILYSRKKLSGTWETVEISRDYAGGPNGIAINSNGMPQVAFRHLQYNEAFGNVSYVRSATLTDSGLWTEQIYNGDVAGSFLMYSIPKIQTNKDQSGNVSTVFGFSRSAYQQNPAIEAMRVYSPYTLASWASVSSSSSTTTSSSSAATSSSSSSVSSTTTSSSSSSVSSNSSSSSSVTSSSSSSVPAQSSSSSSSSSTPATNPDPILVSTGGMTVGDNGDGAGVSYAIDSGSKPSFSYFDANNILKFAQYNGTSWVVEQVDASLANSSETSLVFKNEIPHIFYSNDTNKLVHAYKSTSNSWVKETVSTSDSIAGIFSAATCGSDICVSFYNSVDRDQKLARQSGGIWQISAVDASTDDIGVMSDIAVSSDGTIVVGYYDATNKRLKVASKTTTASWQIESVTYSDSKFGLYPSVAIDGAGSIHVSSSKYKSAATLSDTGIFYSRKKIGGVWETVEISRDYAGGPNAIAINASGMPQVAFRHLQYNQAYGDVSYVRSATLTDSGLWTEQIYSGDIVSNLLMYSIPKIQANKDQSGNISTVFGFSRTAYQQNEAIEAMRLYSPYTLASWAGSSSSSPTASSSSSTATSSSSSSTANGGSSSSVPATSSSSSATSSSSSSVPTQSSSSSSVSSSSSSSSSSSAPALDPNGDEDMDGLTNSEEESIGTNPLLADTDGDGVEDGQEVIDGTNPLDAGSALAVLGTKVCSQLGSDASGSNVIFELVNQTGRTLRGEVTLYLLSGKAASKRRIYIEADAQKDILLQDMTTLALTLFGQVCVSHDGGAGGMDGRVVNYMPDTNGDGSYQFAVATPVSIGKLGAQAVMYNTYAPVNASIPSSGVVENWVQLTNLGSVAVRGTLTLYKPSGAVLASTVLNLNPRARTDYAAHKHGRSLRGLVSWKPDRSDVRVVMRSLRYVYTVTDGVRKYLGAADMEGLAGSGELLSLPIDTRNSSSVIEIANTLPRAVKAYVNLYNSQGVTLKRLTVSLAAYASYLLVTDSTLGSGRIGMVTVKGSATSSIVSAMLNYGRLSDSTLAYVYATPGQQPLGTVLSGSYNTYLGQTDQLMVLNLSSYSRNIAVTLTRADGKVVYSNSKALVIPKNGASYLNISNVASPDSYGVATIQTNVSNVLVGWILRKKGNEFMIPIQMRQ